jgi:thymidylate synthase
MAVREIRNVTLVLENSYHSLVLQKERKLNYAYCILEPILLTRPQNYNTVEACCFYVGKFLKEHVVNKATGLMQGWYGDRINDNGDCQLYEVYKILRDDPGSRRAVITIHNSWNELRRPFSLDIPCTLEIQFMIRNNELQCFVNMRGNDAMLGTPQNVAMWTFFQRMLASWLGIKSGVYVHHVNSMHLYERDAEKAKKIIENPRLEDIEIDLSWPIEDPIESIKQCEIFAEYEKLYRNNNQIPFMETNKLHPKLKGWFEKIIAPKIDKKKQAAIKKMCNPYAVEEC